MYKPLTEQEIEFMEHFYNPKCLMECTTPLNTLNDWENIDAPCMEVRPYQIPFIAYDVCLEDDDTKSDYDNFQLRVKAGTLVVISGRKLGKCEWEENECLLYDGTTKLFKDLVGKEEYVWSLNETTNKLEMAKARFEYNGIKDCINVRLTSGKHITVTENHPLLTQRGWVEVSNLVVGDYVAVPNKYPREGTTKALEGVPELLGYLLGDGGITHGVKFTTTSPEILAEITTLVGRFNCKLTKCSDAITYSIIGKDWTRGHSDKNDIQKMLEAYGMMGKKSIHKTIPMDIYRWNNEQLALLLNRLFACDGHNNTSMKFVEIALASKKMVYQIQELLLRFGIYSIIYDKKSSCNGKIFTAWRLVIARDYDKFLNTIGIFTKDKGIRRNKAYSTSDCIPSELLKEYACLDSKLRKKIKKYKKISKDVVRKFFAKYNAPGMQKYIDADINFEKVTKVEKIPGLKTVAVCVPGNHTYVSNNIISHNTFISLVRNILCKLVYYMGQEMTISCYDALHVRKVADEVCDYMENHLFYRQYKEKINRQPVYDIKTKNGNWLQSVNENITGKKIGQQWWSHHAHFNFQDEYQATTQEANEKKIDAKGEKGCIEILCGIPLISEGTPLANVLKDPGLKKSTIRIPQYVSPYWNEEVKKQRTLEYGGQNSAMYLINVAAEKVEGAYGAFNMQKVRSQCYTEDKVIKHFEVTDKAFHAREEALILFPMHGAEFTLVTADIGFTAATEIIIVSKQNGKYRFWGNVTAYKLSDKELYQLISTIIHKVGGTYCAVDACFDDKTEILTDKGWKGYREINKADKVLSLNPENSKASYESINDIFINVEYSGKVYKHEGKVDFLLTPEHKMLSYNDNRNRKWKMNKIKDFYNSSKERMYVKRTCLWEGIDNEWITIGRSKFAMEDWLQFLGWFISEGHLYINIKKSYFDINICQVKKSGREEIEALLKRMNIRYRYTKSKCYAFRNKEIAMHLSEYTYDMGSKKLCYSKRVPDYIKKMSVKSIRLFLDTFCKGDGTFNKNGSKTYYTTSKCLVDDLQELILKAGGKSSYTTRYYKNYWNKEKECYIHRVYEDKPTSRETCVYRKNVKEENYSGVIWCVETNPHHTIFVRRNGKTYWSGNTVMGAPVYRQLVEEFGRERTFWTAFNENITIGFEKDNNGRVVFDKSGNPMEKKANAIVFAVQRLREMFYEGQIEIPSDCYKFDEQFSSYLQLIKGHRVSFDSSGEDHIVAAFQVFALVDWFLQMASINPLNDSNKLSMGIY